MDNIVTAVLMNQKEQEMTRQSRTLDGLSFVGDESAPLLGIGVEAAASAGVLGGRALAEHLGRPM